MKRAHPVTLGICAKNGTDDSLQFVKSLISQQRAEWDQHHKNPTKLVGTNLPVFCDWLSLSFAARVKENSFDRFIHCENAYGVQWRRPAWVDLRDGRQASDTRKSDSSNIRVRWNAETERLQVSGNLGRWGRRDNVFGVDVYRAAWRFLDFLMDWHRIELLTPPELSRVDLTANIAFQSAQDAAGYIQWAAGVKLGYTAPRLYPSGVTWVTGEWSAKVYDKLVDLRRHGQDDLADKLLAAVGYLLRLETTLRTDELQKYGMTALQSWAERQDAMNIIFSDRFAPIRNPGNQADGVLDGMPYRLRACYEAYRNGTNYLAMVADGQMSRRTYYRLRKELRAFGVDISQPCNVTRLQVKPREVKFQFVEAPEWYGRAA